jgi:TPR repeat protein
MYSARAFGRISDRAQEMPQDYAEAGRWFHLAAEQGHAGAQFNLGTMYVAGVGVPQDFAEGIRWYRKAADQGCADAQRNIGSLYERGHGVPQDFAEAARWYRRAGDQGLGGHLKTGQ